jgi:hypothetical protein
MVIDYRNTQKLDMQIKTPEIARTGANDLTFKLTEIPNNRNPKTVLYSGHPVEASSTKRPVLNVASNSEV